MLMFLSLLIFYQITEDSACTGGGGKKKENIDAWESYINRTKKKREPREHWIIPDDHKSLFGQWVLEYLLNQAKEEKKDVNAEQELKGMNLPEAYKGYGIGHGGQDPPPWAIMPNAHGKPDVCFFDPDKGVCQEKVKRWGYNSYIGKCTQFTYSGCGGNENNFKTKSRCEQMCVHELKSNCQKYEKYEEYKQG